MNNKIPPEIEEEILKEVLKKYLGTSKDLTSFDKCIREMFEEDKLYPAKPIIEQVKGMYNDSAENMRLAVKQAISLAWEERGKQTNEKIAEYERKFKNFQETIQIYQDREKQTNEEVLKLIDGLIELRKGSLNWNVSNYEEIFSINDLIYLKSKLSGGKE